MKKPELYKKIKCICLIVILLVSGRISSFSQQAPMYSQYIMNGFLINPSFAGHDGYTTVTITAREQWVGLYQAPSTHAASFQTRLLRDSYIQKSSQIRKVTTKPSRDGRVGLGGNIFSDHNGSIHRTGLQGSYAFHIPVGRTNGVPNNLGLGLSVIGYNMSVDTDVKMVDQYDPIVSGYDRSVFVFDANFGASFSTIKSYAGLAMTNLFRGSLMIGDTSNINRHELGHFYITGGHKFMINREWIIQPSAFIKSSDIFFKYIQIDLTTRVLYKEDYWLGISYRTKDAFIIMSGLKYSSLILGYSIDFPLTEIRGNSYGTHELILAFKFGASPRKYRWLNAF